MIQFHSRHIDAFQKMHQRHTLPHATLFAGVSGVGKKTCVYEIASFLRTDDVHHSPDVIELDAPSLDEVRALNQTVAKSSFSGGVRVVILDNVQRMNVASKNAFLKTLEEPRSNTIFFLLSPTAESVLPTIRSRCMCFYFTCVNDDTIRELYDTSSIEDLYKVWSGRPAYAQRLLNDEKERDASRQMIDDAGAFLEGAVADRMKLVDVYSEDSKDIERFVEVVLDVARSIPAQYALVRSLCDVLSRASSGNANVVWMVRNEVVARYGDDS